MSLIIQIIIAKGQHKVHNFCWGFQVSFTGQQMDAVGASAYIQKPACKVSVNIYILAC